MFADTGTVTVAPEVSPSNASEVDPLNPFVNGLLAALLPGLIVTGKHNKGGS